MTRISRIKKIRVIRAMRGQVLGVFREPPRQGLPTLLPKPTGGDQDTILPGPN